MFIDLHTHKPSGNQLAVYNLIAGKHSMPFTPEKNVWYSIGIHPWYPVSPWITWDDIVNIGANSQIIAIGECGLDKNILLPLENQITVLKKHIALAEEFKKPLIIHCVKAFNELLSLKKSLTSSVPWIIHGFNSSEQMVEALLEENFYFSLGHMLFNSNSGIYKTAKIIPADRIFLETDESIIPIEDIYRQFSTIRNISIKETEVTIYCNFTKCFNKTII